MILQALKQYADDHKDSLPPDGLQNQEIKFVIEIDSTGKFIQLCDYRENKRGKMFLMPQAIGRSGANAWQTTFLLWDHYGYVLGWPKDDSDTSIQMAQRQFRTFQKMLQELPDEVQKKTEVKAIRLFYQGNEINKVSAHSYWPECAKIPNCNLAFKLVGDTQLVSEKSFVHDYAALQFQKAGSTDEEDSDGDDQKIEGRCLVSGEFGLLKKIHTATPIIGGKSNAKLVGFQVNSGYDSYGKQKAYNAPVSFIAEAAYTKALKYLIKSVPNSVRLAETTMVFWAERQPTDASFNLESEYSWFFTDPPKDNPERNTQAVKALYAAMHTGMLSAANEGGNFFVLGLSPNAARISVRFWKQGTVKSFSEKILRHFEDFEMTRGPMDDEALPLGKILRATVFEYKLDNVPQKIMGDMVQSILNDTEYPQSLLQLCIRRIRAEQKVNRVRAAICKAVINRQIRRSGNKSKEKELTVALDANNDNVGYVLGRLFAVLERCQEQAQGNLNASIRERYYGAFSSTPVSVMPTLLKLNKHHLAKLNPGEKIWFDKLMGEIIGKLEANSIPAHLRLQEQSKFAVGYYHQRQDFFTKKTE